jgi:hypothetical protein
VQINVGFYDPKDALLRVYFLHHRELLGELSRCAYKTIAELMLMRAAAFEEKALRPGMVSVVQTFFP